MVVANANEGTQSKVVLVTGGARSGKSRFAEELVSDIANSTGSVVYIATSQVYDKEMEQRVRAHRNQRPSEWRTVEEPLYLEKTILGLIEEKPAVVLIDCITLWVTNLLLEADEFGKERWQDSQHSEHILERAFRLGKLLQEAPFITVLVTNEVGDSLVPEYPLGRVFRDLAGRVNQALAQASDDVFLVISGIPIRLSELDWRKQQGGGLQF